MNGFTLNLDITDGATPRIQAAAKAIRGNAIKAVAGRSLRNTYRSHFFSLNAARPNKMGGKRTNFYAQVARSVQAPAPTSTGATVAITQVGIRQRIKGGIIRPVNKKLLTIPADPSAYGRRAGEFTNLHAIFFRGGRSVGALVTEDGQVMFWLARKTIQKPDPTILPKEEQVLGPVIKDVGAYINRLIERKNP